MYPTVIEDTAGNQVIVTYNSAIGVPGAPVNTSGRISTIQDVRSVGLIPTTYNFNYSGAVPHLASITEPIVGDPETYYFGYASGVGLMPPFGYDPTYSGQTTTQLTSIGVPVAGTYSFTYDSAGASELTKTQFPWGGYLRWTYDSANYAGSRELREINNRYMNSSATGSGPEYGPYPITHSDSGVGGGIPIVHADATLADASGVGAKKWTFNNSSGTPAWEVGLVSQFTQMASAYGATLTQDTYTWAQTPTSSNPYISQKVSVKDPGTTDAASAQTNQTLDQYGNTTQMVVYPYNSTSTPLATYQSTYVTTSSYIGAYLRGLLASTTMAIGSGSPFSLVTNTYDACNNVGYPTSPGSVFDTAGAMSTYPLRGYLSASTTPAGTSGSCYYWFGVPYETTGVDGTTTYSSVSSATNYTMPDSITTPSYSNSLSYDSWLGVTSTTGANGETMTMVYDTSGRPLTATSAYGAVTTYAYSSSGTFPEWQSATGPNGYQQTTLDGFGRAVLVQSGPNSSTIQSQTMSVYAPCACSPLGKLQQQSQPYAPGGMPAFTTYTYDGIGRTLTTVQPDGASMTSYWYQGNVTKVTDPAANWKTFTSDVSGNLITVLEPNPAGGTFTTSYTYDWMNHLTGSSMARGATTQNRWFSYNSAGQLTSAMNPESGSVYYTYNTDTTLHWKTDANGQTTVYSYDSAKRVLMEQHYEAPPHSSVEDLCQRITYTYDSNSINPSFSHYSYGRLATVQYGDPGTSPGSCDVVGASTTGGAYTEMYSYHPAGGVTAKRLQVLRPPEDDYWDAVECGGTCTPYENGTITLDVGYTYDTAGRRTSITYPMVSTEDLGYPPLGVSVATPVTYTTTYDSMGRPVSLADNFGLTWASSTSYDVANRMTGVAYYPDGATESIIGGVPYYVGPGGAVTETMGYNANGQLTSRNWTTETSSHTYSTMGLSYSYSATNNNGQITQMVDAVSGETVTYGYDALKRLISASSTPNSGSTPVAWTQTYQYDGFGNLTAKVLNGSTTTISIDPTTNRESGPGYDNNGNMLAGGSYTYDGRNRFVQTSWPYGDLYFYDTQNHRVYQSQGGNGINPGQLTLYGAYGERLATYGFNGPYAAGGVYCLTLVHFNIWFNGIDVIGNGMIPYSGVPTMSGDATGYQDRLGTDRSSGARYLPYGEEITSTSNDRTKFATYMRDSVTGLDYAQNRYYASSFGRFNSADQYMGSASAGNPGSWNRYTYAGGDPVGRNDPTGEVDCGADPTDTSCQACEEYDDCAGITYSTSGPVPCEDGSIDYFGDGCVDDGGPLNTSGPVPVVPVQQAQQPSCSISLYERPTPFASSPGWHTYISAYNSSTGVTLDFEGGPQPTWAAVGGTLTGTIALPGQGLNSTSQNDATNPSLTSNVEVGASYSGPNACADVSELTSLINSYNNGPKVTYSFLPIGNTFNSNSFTYTLDSQLGLLGYFGAPGGWVPGWGKLVPGL